MWNIANVLTGIRVLLVPVFCCLLFVGGGQHTAARVAALVVFAVASITDRLDGELARKYDLVTDFGKIADPVADKALIGAALAGLSLLGELPWWVTIVIAVRELGITALRFWVIRYGVIAASPGGKAKTLLQTFAIGLYLFPAGGVVQVLAHVVMGAALILTVATGIDYLVRAWRLWSAARRSDSSSEVR